MSRHRGAGRTHVTRTRLHADPRALRRDRESLTHDTHPQHRLRGPHYAGSNRETRPPTHVARARAHPVPVPEAPPKFSSGAQHATATPARVAASLRGKRRALQNDVLENGLLRPPLLLPSLPAKVPTTHARSAGSRRARTGSSSSDQRSCGTRSSALGCTLSRARR